jgi:dolichol-phosphate mannosyltransferase
MTYQLSIVLPCFNEVGNIAGLISDIRKCGWTEDQAEIVVIDDGSTDGTSELLARLEKIDSSLIVLRPNIRRGLGLSIYDGIRVSRAELIAVMDTDGIHDPSYLAQMVSRANSSNSMIIGSRYVSGGIMQGAIYPHLSKVMNMLVKFITQSSVNDQLCGFFVAQKSLLLKIQETHFNGFGEYFIFVINHFEKNGAVSEIPTVHNVRLAGKRKSVRSKMAKAYLRTAFKVRNS